MKFAFKGWESITLEQYNRLAKATDIFEICSIVTDVEPEVLKKIPFEKVQSFVEHIEKALSEPPQITRPKSIKLGKMTLYPPKLIERLNGQWWSDATWEQLQAVMIEQEYLSEKKDLTNFALVCAVLLRQKGEMPTEDLIYAREQMFLRLDMATIWECFFLLKKWLRSFQKNLITHSKVSEILLSLKTRKIGTISKLSAKE